jgi:hypothetical protein
MQPFDIRAKVLRCNSLPDAIWIETGTYLGETTILLSQLATVVYSIEPGPKLFADALEQFKHDANVKIINGLSEDVLPKLLPTLDGNICFWLDGHYTDELTHKGPQDTPIIDELACIGDNISRMSNVVVMIDDIHLFNGKTHIYGTYPPIETVMDWALDRNLAWHIEHDIFIAKK